ncbi:hypothetical protein NR800_32735 [Corallococcus interemptor]|uniref:hypothetical protein n=1 Tax=Corallococcus interemptor TaxID=2316720 RepID=UPI0035D47BB3
MLREVLEAETFYLQHSEKLGDASSALHHAVPQGKASPLSQNPEVKAEDVLEVLGAAMEQAPKGSREWKAFEAAAFCLLYVQEHDKLEDFAHYYRERLDPNFKIKVERDFGTRAEAEVWLKSGEALHRMQIRIDGKGFLVVQLPGRLTLMNNPLPEELGTDDSED